MVAAHNLPDLDVTAELKAAAKNAEILLNEAQQQKAQGEQAKAQIMT
jgi:hypothetical protein